MIEIITLGIIIGTAFLIKKSKKQNTSIAYIYVLIGGIITFLFVPLISALFIDGERDYGAISAGIQMSATIFGIYTVIWSIIKIVKLAKNK